MALAGSALAPSTPTLALLVTALVVAAALVLWRPPVDAWTVIAVAPWAVVGALISVLAGTGAYGPRLTALFTGSTVAVATAVPAGLAWVTVNRIAAIRGRPGRTSVYLGTAGVGATLVLVFVFLLRVPVSAAGAVWLVVVPVAAGALAGVTYFALGVQDATVLAETGGAGLLAVFGHVLEGLAVVVAVDVVGRSPQWNVVAGVLRATADLPVPDAFGVAWPYLVVKLLFVLAVLSVLARLTDRSRVGVALLIAVVAAAGIGPGVAVLLEIAAA